MPYVVPSGELTAAEKRTLSTVIVLMLLAAVFLGMIFYVTNRQWIQLHAAVKEMRKPAQASMIVHEEPSSSASRALAALQLYRAEQRLSGAERMWLARNVKQKANKSARSLRAAPRGSDRVAANEGRAGEEKK